LAACTAVIEGCDATTDDLQVSAKPNAMILFNPALWVAPDKRMSSEELRRAKSVANRARTSMARVSPLNHASAKQPPTIMFFGTEDDLLRGAEFFKQDSEKAGNTCKLVTYDGQGHGFFNHGKYRQLTIREMDAFLVGLGWLQPLSAR
jgi:acetyl esterase/lipase